MRRYTSGKGRWQRLPQHRRRCCVNSTAIRTCSSFGLTLDFSDKLRRLSSEERRFSMQEHTVVITLDSTGKPVPHGTGGKEVEMVCHAGKGDQIRWISPQGTAKVEFQQGKTPFQDGQLIGDQTYREL